MENKKRKYQIVIELETETKEEAEKLIREKFNVISIKCLQEQRTLQQNAALYLFFRLLSEELNSAGFDMKKTIRSDIDISWTPESVKNYLWKPLQKALFGSDSTTKLKRTDIDIIFDNLNKIIAERTKGEVSIPFPSIESLIEYEN